MVIGWLDDERVPAWESWHQKETRLGARQVQVRAVEQETASYADLATSAAVSRVGVVFEAPTLVRRGGRNLPLPEPELLVSGLVRRWNAFSPLAVPEPQAAELLASVYVARHAVRTVPLELRGRGRAGFVGTATFGIAGQAPLALRRWLAALWRFASFSGVGAHTTHGLGQVTVYPGEDPPSAGASRSRRRSADHGAHGPLPQQGAAR
ncbi:CRISPR system precrRNA processing endoribonuclease RAMP protein Cas6 [Nocardiopsis sp. RSe5-2]|uniref:CRISPR system precrRNA processing endoribonuclease RAMP protein Cas6 n=1 Tax=Nocardiopsis endophytica TaxID=3018445 RepID=A0ABT4U0P8_9ACTN|nr:CRISPR system precrRNA processing endoribonuclease RAMP protein Cas6 [Nocardiopsis endophytica]MDA2810519.1 CRISPR system precrRNA processing endoribonuclease RAMP protein Cas6 [Nocardiopsis endophytica]